MQFVQCLSNSGRYTWLCLAMACMFSGLVGCDSGPKIVPVTGTVTLDGKPLPFKAVFFYPDRSSGTEGNGAGGYTDGDSKFYLVANLGGTTSDRRGACPGKYRVTVTEPAIPIDENSFAKKVEAEGDTPAPAVGLPARPAKRTIPAHYSSPDLTPLTVEVPPNGGEIKLELSSKA